MIFYTRRRCIVYVHNLPVVEGMVRKFSTRFLRLHLQMKFSLQYQKKMQFPRRRRLLSRPLKSLRKRSPRRKFRRRPPKHIICWTNSSRRKFRRRPHKNLMLFLYYFYFILFFALFCQACKVKLFFQSLFCVFTCKK